ncbi:hypothetical protein [Lentzea sp. HUAS12]|uniref:hypothetical protein n=1 Tax=Lentzea sp. HUAS12 TaxID=2951806 RepID=UPI0020A086E5|nr:hypothetical protein [Lentzea sp. HUAS12]USX56429.1 hypothetical protein ND450_20700 [Lentzea sp. HUAS12]
MSDAGLYLLGGTLTMIIGAANRPLVAFVVAAGAVLVAMGVLIARCDYLRFGHDLSARSQRSRSDRGAGLWFFRASDFTGRERGSAATAAQIIEAVNLSHSGPAASLTGHAKLAALHGLAWEALVVLHKAPAAHDDLRPILGRLNAAAARTREANRRLYATAARDRTGDLLAYLDALHEVLPVEGTS